MSDGTSDDPQRFERGLAPSSGGEPEEPPLVEPPDTPEPPSWDLPTELTPEPPSWDLPTELTPEPPSRDLPTELTPEQPEREEPAPDEPAPDVPKGIDALFGADQFRDYDDTLLSQQAPSPGRPRRRDVDSMRPSEHHPGGAPRSLLIAAGALVGVLVLVLVFIVGTRLNLHTAAAVAPSAAPSSPTPTATSTAALGAGTYQWDALHGGECLTDFESAWQQTYTVVDCGATHTAQLIAVGTFDDARYPGADVLASRMTSLCSSRTHVDYSVAAQYEDIEIQGSYAADEEQWGGGDRTYYCFASRASGNPIEGSLSKKARA